jgi:signal transduction histidine kinase
MSTKGWRVPINVKLLAVLAVPVLGYLLIATTLVGRAQRTAHEIREQSSVVKTAVGPTSLTTSLIDERTITALEGAGLQDDLTLRIGSGTEARRATDEQLDELRTLIDDNGEAAAVYVAGVEKIDNELDGLRADVDSGAADEADLFNRYSDLIDSLMDANAKAVERVDDAVLWQGAKLSELATRQKDARGILINALIPVSLNEGAAITPRQTTAIGRSLGAYENRDAAIQELATGPYARAGSVLVEATEAADLAELARGTLESGSLDSTQLFDVASYKGGFVYDLPSGDYIHDYFRANIVEYVTDNAGIRTANADRSLRNHLIAGTLGLIITAFITWLVSRSIIRPLRSLTQQAIEAATNRLPATVYDILETPLGEDVAWPEMDPIDVTTRDEVADVANALNTMQESALELAVEEAILRRHITDSLITLGQRNQRLLSRQLAFITDLERDETDPDTLADLFFLDHLAIRMRRNAESLLVLAGFDPPRKWVGPTSISDIVRAALGETEEYKRVWVQTVEPAIVGGSATAELSHLLAELIENALVFSPRGETVEINGWHEVAGDGSRDGFTVTVADSGVGMSAEEIDRANRRLAGGESFPSAPSKYMGHYVTGKLAARHGIAVQLMSNTPNNGVTATIYIPTSLLTSDAPAPDVPRLLPTLPAHSTAEHALSAAPDDDEYEVRPVRIAGRPDDVPEPTLAPAPRPAAGPGADDIPPPPAVPVPAPAAAGEPPALYPLPSMGDEHELPPLPLPPAEVPRKARKRKSRSSAGFQLPVPPPSKPLEAPDSDVS